MELRSPAFSNGEYIPAKYTCDGENISPPLKIHNVPAGTEALVLVMDDPDAPMGTFDHWLAWNIPGQIIEIKEGVEPAGIPGMTDFGRPGYGGPCPPSGTHTYQFRLYALSKKLDLPRGTDKQELEAAMEGYIVSQALLKGKYQRGR